MFSHLSWGTVFLESDIVLASWLLNCVTIFMLFSRLLLRDDIGRKIVLRRISNGLRFLLGKGWVNKILFYFLLFSSKNLCLLGRFWSSLFLAAWSHHVLRDWDKWYVCLLLSLSLQCLSSMSPNFRLREIFIKFSSLLSFIECHFFLFLVSFWENKSTRSFFLCWSLQFVIVAFFHIETLRLSVQIWS